MFKRNVPNWERALRALMGAGLLAAAFAVPLTGWALWAAIAAGAGALGSAAMGFCPACAMAGRKL